MKPPKIDLRIVYDEKAPVKGGTLYRYKGTVQVWWDRSGPETWTLPDNEWGRREAEENFRNMKERFNED